MFHWSTALGQIHKWTKLEGKVLVVVTCAFWFAFQQFDSLTPLNLTGGVSQGWIKASLLFPSLGSSTYTLFPDKSAVCLKKAEDTDFVEHPQSHNCSKTILFNSVWSYFLFQLQYTDFNTTDGYTIPCCPFAPWNKWMRLKMDCSSLF